MREAKPYYKKSHKCWYVNLNGKPCRLHADKKEAWKLYHALAAEVQNDQSDKLASITVTVQDVIAEFLAWIERNREPRTLESYQRYLSGRGNFADYVGPRLLVRDLKPYHLLNWLEKRHGKACTTTKAAAIASVKRVFSWAASGKDGRGYITESPVASVSVPERASRGEEAYLTLEQWDQIVTTVEANPKKEQARVFLDVLIVLKETGCRPQELRRVEARHFNRANRTWTFPKEENRKNRKVPRVVHLSERAFEITQRLALRYPEGPLFRNEKGKPWTNFALSCRCKRLEKKLGFKLFVYAVRHTFATQAIVNGVDVVTIATLMGHADLKMLMKIYQHVQKNQAHMKAKLQQAITASTDAA